MNARRLPAAFAIALTVSGLCTWALSRKMTARAPEKLAEIGYVAPARPLGPGELLRADNLEMVAWPAKDPITGSFTKLDDLVGRSVLYPISKDQPITDKFLSTPGSGVGLAAKIPQGMRAIALRSDEVMGVAGFLFPGSHIDVLVTLRTTNSPDPTTCTVLQDAEVLAVGQRFQPEPDGKPATATVVTLLLTPEDAERAVLASTQGNFHFVLRSGSDRLRVVNRPISLSGLSGDRPTSISPPRMILTHAVAAPRPVARNQIVVETIAGEKQSTETFGVGR